MILILDVDIMMVFIPTCIIILMIHSFGDQVSILDIALGHITTTTTDHIIQWVGDMVATVTVAMDTVATVTVDIIPVTIMDITMVSMMVIMQELMAECMAAEAIATIITVMMERIHISTGIEIII